METSARVISKSANAVPGVWKGCWETRARPPGFVKLLNPTKTQLYESWFWWSMVTEKTLSFWNMTPAPTVWGTPKWILQNPSCKCSLRTKHCYGGVVHSVCHNVAPLGCEGPWGLSLCRDSPVAIGRVCLASKRRVCFHFEHRTAASIVSIQVWKGQISLGQFQQQN